MSLNTSEISRPEDKLAIRHFPPGTTYRVVPQKDMTYGAEVTKPKAMPYTITGFGTEAAAQVWIRDQLKKTQRAARRQW